MARACGLPLSELSLPSWGGHQDERAGLLDASRRSAAKRQSKGQAEGQGPKVEGSESRGPEAHWGERGAEGTGGSGRVEMERMILLPLVLPCWLC